MNRSLVVIGALCALALTTGCKKKIDSGKVEKHILEKLASGGYKFASVTCPKDIAVKKDAKFTCEVKGDDGEFKVEATMTDDDGYVTYKPVGALIDTKALTDAAEKKNPEHKLKFTCPKRLVILDKKGDTTTCEVSEGDKKGKFVITLEDAEKETAGYAIKMD